MNALSPETIPGRCKLLNPGAAWQPIRDTRPLPQGIMVPCGVDPVPRMARNAAPLPFGPYCA
ncbi:hypothetical protein FGL97_06330 [Pseudomonas putida]|nr:hypothetical protein [Pseudomonas putida]NVN67513.1 hypothetical protein [Pseudomonas putida]